MGRGWGGGMEWSASSGSGPAPSRHAPREGIHRHIPTIRSHRGQRENTLSGNKNHKNKMIPVGIILGMQGNGWRACLTRAAWPMDDGGRRPHGSPRRGGSREGVGRWQRSPRDYESGG